MDVSSYLAAAAVVVWVVARQFAGRFVPARRSLLLPLRPSRRGAGERATLAR